MPDTPSAAYKVALENIKAQRDAAQNATREALDAQATAQASQSAPAEMGR